MEERLFSRDEEWRGDAHVAGYWKGIDNFWNNCYGYWGKESTEQEKKDCLEVRKVSKVWMA